MLDTVKRRLPPEGGWKIVALDNGSTDDTSEIPRHCAADLPMTVISEPSRGKNVALNAGLSHTEGDLVALTDDDVLLPPGWLVNIVGLVKAAGHLTASNCKVVASRPFGTTEDRFAALSRLHRCEGDFAERISDFRSRLTALSDRQ